jgi:hypothetical protein
VPECKCTGTEHVVAIGPGTYLEVRAALRGQHRVGATHPGVVPPWGGHGWGRVSPHPRGTRVPGPTHRGRRGRGWRHPSPKEEPTTTSSTTPTTSTPTTSSTVVSRTAGHGRVKPSSPWWGRGWHSSGRPSIGTWWWGGTEGGRGGAVVGHGGGWGCHRGHDAVLGHVLQQLTGDLCKQVSGQVPLLHQTPPQGTVRKAHTHT